MKILKKRDATLTNEQRETLLGSKKTVLSYSIVLVAVILIFLVISILISKRNSSELWSAQAKIEQMQDTNKSLTDKNAELTQTIAAQDLQMQELAELIEDLQDELDSAAEAASATAQESDAQWTVKYDALLRAYHKLCEKYGLVPEF
ncbi:MAG: hypothetical protein LBO63_08050 [Oscillospiraceae bacterium]|jgi:predicted PurR-regulated permease PerM|nr:hypothetical protein [Oscillospiraceae bacterium]